MTECVPRSKLPRALLEPWDATGLVAFRVLFGLLMAVSTARFLLNGWVDAFFVRPEFHFKYWGFGWVEAWPAWGMYAHFVLLFALSVMIAIGAFYRVAIVLFFLAFSYVQLIDVTNYLNHYYLVSLLAFLMCFLPLERAGSV